MYHQKILTENFRLKTEGVGTQNNEIKPVPLQKIKKTLKENYSLIAVLVGVVLVSASIAPFHNIDINLEYETSQAVIQWGMPYNPVYGTFLNQPPVGFYIEAAFFMVFGSFFEYGAALITAFGVATTLLVYEVGKLWYGKRTGLLAAALFGFTPWQLILSRSFLIDVPCLFFSLLFLFVGLLAIRGKSFKLFVVSGAIFAVAFLTKFYAVYMLIPLTVFFFYNRPWGLKERLKWIAAFFLPLLLGFVLWYQVISGQGLLTIFSHGDFFGVNSAVAPSPFFVMNFLVTGVGFLFLFSAFFSVMLTFLAKEHFEKIVIFDLMCFAIIAVAVAVNTYLGAVQNLSCPYCNAIKYIYQALPFLSLLAASLVGKSVSLLRAVSSKGKSWRVMSFFVVFLGVFLVVMSLYRNMDYDHLFSTWNYLLFRADAIQTAGYSFFSPNATSADSPLMAVQTLGFGVALSGLVWAGRREFGLLRSRFQKGD